MQNYPPKLSSYLFYDSGRRRGFFSPAGRSPRRPRRVFRPCEERAGRSVFEACGEAAADSVLAPPGNGARLEACVRQAAHRMEGEDPERTPLGASLRAGRGRRSRERVSSERSGEAILAERSGDKIEGDDGEHRQRERSEAERTSEGNDGGADANETKSGVVWRGSVLAEQRKHPEQTKGRPRKRRL